MDRAKMSEVLARQGYAPCFYTDNARGVECVSAVPMMHRTFYLGRLDTLAQWSEEELARCLATKVNGSHQQAKRRQSKSLNPVSPSTRERIEAAIKAYGYTIQAQYSQTRSGVLCYLNAYRRSRIYLGSLSMLAAKSDEELRQFLEERLGEL